jgi:hypothetical protein
LRKNSTLIEVIEFTPVLSNGEIEFYQTFSLGWVTALKLGEEVDPMALLPKEALEMLR